MAPKCNNSCFVSFHIKKIYSRLFGQTFLFHFYHMENMNWELIKNNPFIFIIYVLYIYINIFSSGWLWHQLHFCKIDLFAFAMNSLRTKIKINELNLFCFEFRSINFRHVENSDRGKQKFNQIRSNKLACASTSNLYSHKTIEWHLKAIPLSILSYSTITSYSVRFTFLWIIWSAF